MTPAPLQVGHAPSEFGLNSEEAGVGGRVTASRAPYRGLVDRHHAFAGRYRAVDERTLARAGDAGHHAEHSQRDVDVHVPDVVGGGAAHLQDAGGRPDRVFEPGPVVEVPAGHGVAAAEAVDGPLVADPPALGAGAGSQVDDVVGDRDGLGLVFDDEKGVALVAQPQEQGVHPFDVVGVQSDRGLVEDVGDVREGRAQVSDHLDPLGLTARERPGGPVQ